MYTCKLKNNVNGVNGRHRAFTHRAVCGQRWRNSSFEIAAFLAYNMALYASVVGIGMSELLPELAFGELTEVVAFLMEIDKLKSIQRRTKVLGTQRQENTAEHSWHFAVGVMALAPYAGDKVDINRVIQMALVHDIVEIDAGDVLVYDLAGRAAVHAQEEEAAIRLFGLLPEPQRQHFHQLWLEYEAGETPNAQFALMLDRLMPVLMNLHNRGQSWVENGISLEQVLSRNAFIGDVYPALWQHLQRHLDAAHQNGWLK